MRIELKHFQESGNKGLIADSVPRSYNRDEGTGVSEPASNYLKLRW